MVIDPIVLAVLLALAAAAGAAGAVRVLQLRAKARSLRNRTRRIRKAFRPHIALTDHSLEPRLRTRGRGRS